MRHCRATRTSSDSGMSTSRQTIWRWSWTTQVRRAVRACCSSTNCAAAAAAALAAAALTSHAAASHQPIAGLQGPCQCPLSRFLQSLMTSSSLLYVARHADRGDLSEHLSKHVFATVRTNVFLRCQPQN